MIKKRNPVFLYKHTISGIIYDELVTCLSPEVHGALYRGLTYALRAAIVQKVEKVVFDKKAFIK